MWTFHSCVRKTIWSRVFAMVLITSTRALPNGVARLPLIGWNSWCSFGPCGTDVCTEAQVNDTMTAMTQNGLISLGYNYFTLDDCFAMRRDSQGVLFPDPALFPNGFTSLVDRAHSLGLKFGIYTSAGNFTCKAKKVNCNGTCNVGSLGHYSQDAKTFASWGLDFIKMDWCSASVAHLSCEKQYGEMAKALNATGRRIAFYMSCGGGGRKQRWAKDVANVWRIGNDHLDCWDDGPCPRAIGYHSNGHGTKQAIRYLTGISKFSGPGGWNTPDFLKTGGESCDVKARPGDLCPKQTLDEYITEYTVWSMTSSPLLISTDVRNLTSIQRTVLLNSEVIAVDQQPTAGDLVDTPACLPPRPSDQANASKWRVFKNADGLPMRPVETHGVFHNYGPTKDGAQCQQACSTNASCTIYEWSAKSNNCWWRLDGKLTLRASERRETGCLVDKVPACNSTPPPPPSPPPSPPGRGSCEVWAKPLVETAYPATKGWSSLASHHAVMLLNLDDQPAVVPFNLSTLGPGKFSARDVWSATTVAVGDDGMINATLRPHASALYRVWIRS